MWQQYFNAVNLQQPQVDYIPPSLGGEFKNQNIATFSFMCDMIRDKKELGIHLDDFFTRYRQDLIELLLISADRKATHLPFSRVRYVHNPCFGNSAVRHLCGQFNQFYKKRVITPGRKSKKHLCLALVDLLKSLC